MTDRRRTRRLGRLRRAFALAAGLALLAQVAPGAAQTTQQKLEDAESQLKRIQAQLEVQQDRLAALRAEVDSLTKQILQAIAQRDQLQDQIDATNKVIKRKGKRVQALQDRLGARARDVYIQGPAGVLEFVLEASSLSDLSDRVNFLEVLNESDSSVAVGIEVEREELGRFEDDLKGYLEEQRVILEKFKEQKEQLDAKFVQQVKIEQAIAAKRAEAEETVKDLKAQIRRELLAALAVSTASSGIKLKPGQGLLQHCPVDSPRSYIDDFGFPRVGHTHQGNDVFAPHGTPIRAPFAGRADEGSNGLGGLTVNVYSPDGTYVYNAHMSAYAGVDGDQVQPGDLIGYVGNTGNAVGTPPHDHFELHPGGGSAISPYAHLNLVCGINGAG